MFVANSATLMEFCKVKYCCYLFYSWCIFQSCAKFFTEFSLDLQSLFSWSFIQ